MRTKMMAIVALAVAILGVIFMISPQATVVVNDVTGEVYSIDILGLTEKANALPVQQYAAH